MKALREYLKTISPTEQDAFAKRCDTSIGYLRKAISTGQKLRVPLAIDIERESGGRIRCEQIRPDVDWAQLRSGAKKYPRRAAVA